jgi:hypothetical protein
MMKGCSAHKLAVLRASGTLHPFPERVRAPLFQANPFFDAYDLVQVKYEMLRTVAHEEAWVQDAAELFGLSRTTWYQIEKKYATGGIPGLLPTRFKKRGAATPIPSNG